MKSFVSLTFTVLAILLLAVSGLLTSNFPTSASYNSSQHLSINLTGSVVSAGSQQYLIQQSGPAASVTVPGYSIVSGQIDYNLTAFITGESVLGAANFILHGTQSGGGQINVSSDIPLVGMIAGVCLPNYDAPSASGACESNDTSAVPAFFVGMGPVQIVTSSSNVTLSNVVMLFESAYLNPFGAPLVISSNDSSIVIITGYTSAIASWNNVVDSGAISGSFGNESISGIFGQVASEHENLVTGRANDSGRMTFSSVTNGTGSAVSQLDVTGSYSGNSSIPLAGSYDCSASLGFPAGSGICTDTGFDSAGSFSLLGGINHIVGSYRSTWTIPAFGFSGNASATLAYLDPPPPPLVEGNVIWYTPTLQHFQYIYPAGVAINGKQFSSVFYESLLEQYQLVPGLPYAGYYSGTFGAISGCQPGANITITATVSGSTESASGTCPAGGSILSISLQFGNPPTT